MPEKRHDKVEWCVICGGVRCFEVSDAPLPLNKDMAVIGFLNVDGARYELLVLRDDLVGIVRTIIAFIEGGERSDGS